MELAITKYLKEHGLEKTLADFKLKHKDYPHKILIKYDSIESNFTNEEVRDSRGLVLEKGTWKVMSLSFRKFFNLGEGHAAEIDWENARVFKKLDGTMIHIYHDYVTGDICFGTTGTAEGEGDVDNFHHTQLGGTFSDLFVHAFCETIKKTTPELIINSEGIDRIILVKAWFAGYAGYTLVFELCTPYNIVVSPHDESSIHLLGARKLDTLQEVSFEELETISKELHIPLAPTLFLKSNPDELKETFENMPYSNEGYVVCDNKHNRVKIKNPAYCAIHFFKDSTAFWRLVDIVRSGDDNVNEYKATFPGRGEEIDHLQAGWNFTLSGLDAFTKDISDLKEFIEFRNYKEQITVQERISNTVFSPLQRKFEDLGHQYSSLTANEIIGWSTEQMVSLLDISENDANSLRTVLMTNRGDTAATLLRKNAVFRIMTWAEENKLKRHVSFFFRYLDNDCSAKKYMMGWDGKELYNELIKGFITTK